MGRKTDGGAHKLASKCTAFSGFYCKKINIFFLIANSSYLD